MKGIVIIVLGLLVTPVIVAVCDWAAPLFVSVADWSDDQVAITILALKFLWPIGISLLGLIVFVRNRQDKDQGNMYQGR